MPNSLKLSDKINYGVGSIAYSLPYTLLGGVFLIYATVILKISPLYAGVIVAISALWDGISDPLMGYISDKTKSIFFGKRHLYILSGSILTALFTWLFWSIDPSQSTVVKITSLTLYVLALKTTLTIFVIPYNAFGGELSNDYDERSSVQSWRASFYIFGMLLSIIISNVIYFKPTEEFARGQLNPAVYPQLGTTFAAIILVIGLFTFFQTKSHISHKTESTKQYQSFRDFLKSVRTCLTNKNMRALALMIFTIEVGFQITVANGLHINTFAYNLVGSQMAILGLLLLGSSIVSQPFWVKFTKKYDKKPALVLAGIFAIAGFTLGPWLIIWWEVIPVGSSLMMPTLGLFAVFAGIGNGAFMSIPFSMISDSLDQSEQQSGTRDDGIFFGVYTFAYKAGISVSLLVSGLVLHFIGFDAELSQQSESTIFYLALVPSWLIVSILPLAFLFIGQYKINRKSNKKIHQNKRENQITETFDQKPKDIDDELEHLLVHK